MKTKQVELRDFEELHKLIGMALWHSQAFEDTLCRFIALILKLPPSRAETEMMEVLESLETKTLGALIAELRKANSSNSVSEFEQRMNRYLTDRNWLVHKSWREHHTDLFNPSALPALFSRLRSIAEESRLLQRYFVELTTAWTLQQPGITMELIRQAQKEQLRQRGVIA